VGSIVASFLCTLDDENLRSMFKITEWNFDFFENSTSVRKKLLRLLRKGVLMDSKKLELWLRKSFGELTFKEAFEKTRKILNITVSSTEQFEVPRVLNYLTAPNVLIWSAICASCALPYLFNPVELMVKDKKGMVSPYHPPGQKWRLEKSSFFMFLRI